ncbi:hypothetical protein HRI_003078400 [Hibiscus trionum]|uniref:Uncharacterized protein n=1 Tax=Hibiscus trionum TaxID=183268 RepID=A0A9W7IFE4_HIBTR|nr:hypothetical protein HRI_003078400 [Hibiscus trionum]
MTQPSLNTKNTREKRQVNLTWPHPLTHLTTLLTHLPPHVPQHITSPRGCCYLCLCPHRNRNKSHHHFTIHQSPQPPAAPTMLPSAPLYKHPSWSPDIFRDEAWLRRKGNSKKSRSKSVTDEDLDELKACIELGFGFNSPEVDQRLSDTLPALGLYYAVNKNYNDTVMISKPSASSPSVGSDCESIPSPIGSPHSIVDPGDNPQTVKTRLRQWAQVVACSVRQSS